MDNIFDMLGKLGSQKSQNESSQAVPKEILDQYPYGQFPLRYTKSGQEILRKQSENRFSYEQEKKTISTQGEKQDSGLNMQMLIPLIQMLSGGKKNQKDMMQIFSKLLFKDNPDMQKLFSMLPNIKGQEINNSEDFPDTNKVKISTLKKIE